MMDIYSQSRDKTVKVLFLNVLYLIYSSQIPLGWSTEKTYTAVKALQCKNCSVKILTCFASKSALHHISHLSLLSSQDTRISSVLWLPRVFSWRQASNT